MKIILAHFVKVVDIDIKVQEKDLDTGLKKKLETLEGKIDDHIYSEKHAKQVIEIFQSVLRQIVENCDDSMLTCCLLEKRIYSVVKNGIKYYKSGFHLAFPYIFLSKNDQENHLNPRIIEALKELEVFEDLGFEDSSKLFDDGISGKPWLLYGSRKEDSKPYVLTNGRNTANVPNTNSAAPIPIADKINPYNILSGIIFNNHILHHLIITTSH